MPADSIAAPVTQPLASPTRPMTAGGRQILDLLLKTGGLSQAEITRALDLAQPSVARLLQGFHQDGVIRVASRQAHRRGNPSVQATLNPDFAYALGVSMLGDVLSLVLMDLEGKARGYRSVAMPSMSRQAVLETLVGFKAQLVAEAGIAADRIIGVGVGVSGFFIGDGKLLDTPKYLSEWALVDIEPILEDALGLPVRLDNDGTVAAIGESLFGVGRSCANFAYLHLTNGFGGGLIADGKVQRGEHGNAGEFGGVWNLTGEVYPNLDLLRSCLARHGRQFETVEAMVRAIDVGSPGVEEWMALAVPPFSRLAGMLTYVVDPRMIVLGGRLPADVAGMLAQRITLPQPTNRWGRPQPLPQVVVSKVEGDPVAMGAASMPLQSAFFL